MTSRPRDPEDVVRDITELTRELNMMTLDGYPSLICLKDTSLVLAEWALALPQALDQLRHGLGQLVDDGKVALEVALRPRTDDEEPVPGDTLLERQAHFDLAIRGAHGAVEAMQLALDEVRRTAHSLADATPAGR